MIKVSNLSKAYGHQILFQDLNFHINAKERIGLVGRNGSGKSTLFRLLLGQEEPDSGEIVIPKHYQLGHLQQHIHFTEPTIIGEACLGLPRDQQHDTWRVEKILFGLGFAETDLNRQPAEFSGGFQVRLSLAKVLVSSPDCLLLDEPTNYLDIVSIRWLIKFLNAWKNEMILITHDRHFMDQVTTHTMGIHRQKIRKLEGPTEKYYMQLVQDEAIYEKTRLHDEKRRKEIELFISRFRAKARLAGLVQSRIKTLEKTQKYDQLEKIESLDFEFIPAEFPAKVMLETHNLTFAYSEQSPVLIKDLNLTIGRRDRIAVIGKNGKGKSTLLKLLAKELAPVQGGVKHHPKLSIGYFGQTNIDRLDPAKTIEEEIMGSDPACQRRQARDICGAMMFSGDTALKKISVLSGGEKSRVLLGKLLLAPSHLLLLDEPTNHLDMDSCEALLNAIQIFEGSAVIVTHDEMFLHALASQFIVFNYDQVFSYKGSYQDFLNEIGWQGEEKNERTLTLQNRFVLQTPAQPEEPGDAPSKTITMATAKDLRKAKAKVVQERSRALKPLETEIRELEQSIERIEQTLARNQQDLIEASEQGDVQAIAVLPRQNRDLQQQAAFLYGKLEKLTSEYERKSAEYDRKIQALEADTH